MFIFEENVLIKQLPFPRKVLAALMVTLWVPGASMAQTLVWSGGGGDSNWSTGANWVDGNAPPSSNTSSVLFDSLSGNFTPNANSIWTLNRLDISGATSYALTGSALTFDGTSPQINTGGAAHSIANDISLAATTSFTTGSNLTLSGAISGTVGMDKSGVGTLTLTQVPTHTGITTISAGTLNIGGGGAVGGGFGGDIVNNGALVIDSSSGISLNSLSGTGTLTKNGSGLLVSGATWTHSGDTTINGGAIANSINSTGRLTVNTGGQYDSGGSTFGSLAGSGGFVGINGVASTMTVGGDNTNTTYAGLLGGDGMLVKTGTGTLTLTQMPTITGITTISAGTLNIGGGGAVGGGFGGDIVNNGALVLDSSSGISLNSLSGTGTLTKNGSGLLVSGATWTHSGNTTINGGSIANQINSTGRLTVNAGGQFDTGLSTFGSIVSGGGNVYINGAGTLTVGGDNTSTTFAGELGGDGTLIKNGTGTLTFTGNSLSTGAITLNGGMVVMNGSTTATVNVNAGGMFSGSGTIGGLTAAAGGIIAPGNSIGTLTVNGALTFNPGSIYRVETDAAGASDRINVVGAPGTATIGGGTVDVQAGAGTYSPATIYTIINATGGVAGTFSSVTSNLAFLTPSLAYDPNNVFLTLTRNAATFPSVALTPNQIAVSNMLEPVANAGPTGDMGTVVNGLLGLSAPQARAAFDAIGGASIVELRRANVAFARVFTGELDSRIQQQAGAGAAKSGEQPASPDGRGFWIKANASAYRTDGDGNAFENEVRGGSIAFGADAAPAKDVIVGLAAAYGKGNLDFDGIPDSGWTRNGALAVYGNYETGPWAFKGIAGYAFGRNQLDRPIVFGPIARVAQGDFDSQSGTVYAEATYDIPMDGFSLRPLAGLSWVLSRQQGFTESGADALNLAVTGETTNSLRTLIGVKALHALPTGNGGVVYLEPRLLWSHEFGDLNTPLDAQLTGAGAAGNFTVAGVNLKRDSAIAGLRVSGSVSKDVELFADILVSGNSSQTSASAYAGLRMAW